MTARFQQTCVTCHVICERPQEWQRHLATKKHLAALVAGVFACNACARTYKHRAGLWRHQRLVHADSATAPAAAATLTDLVINVVKSNAELQKQNLELHQQVLEICKKMASESGDHSVTTNSHNKTFNLNFFLNEECKHAMNLSEFVDSFKLQLSDLEHVGKNGYVNGISHLITQRLREMDIYARPIHCSDVKRDILHVKDKDVWEKDTADFAKLRYAVKHIANKNAKLLHVWREKYPDSSDINHKNNDEFMVLVLQALGGDSKSSQAENENKIIGKIMKEVVIGK